MLIVLLACISVAVATPASEYSGRKRYDNYRLISVQPENEQQLKVLGDFQTKGYDSVFFDFWADPTLKRPAEFTVSPSQYEKVMQYLRDNNMTPTVEVDDIQMFENIAEFEAKVQPELFFNNIVDHSQYHRYDQISEYLTGFANNFGSIARKRSMSQTTYGRRTMDYLEISTNGFAGTRRAILIEAGIHAREWISPAAILYITDRLLASYTTDSEAAYMLNSFDWIIIPVTNPDGYEYSHTDDRYWRKNRHYRGGNCRGVDLNRNFDARWGTTGVSSSCSSDIYPGSAAMSEIEAQNVQDLVADIQNGGTRLIGYLAVHSYSQMILLPYSHTFGSRPPNYQNLDNYGISAGNALYNVHGRRFQVGTGPELLYAASGGSDDWAIMGGSVKYAYTYELRPATASAGGFVLPASQIVPSGEELFASFYNLAISLYNDS
ncbi:hypothetical protein SNE40_007237 [Patella caerulea]|uniref:Peptidase M14 domain-containing protein n=1 Tax=Patella caerulea TaxID=87958 RepID=A0AAN8Q808_PATCE